MTRVPGLSSAISAAWYCPHNIIPHDYEKTSGSYYNNMLSFLYRAGEVERKLFVFDYNWKYLRTYAQPEPITGQENIFIR